MLENKKIFQDKVVTRREAEFNKLKREREDRLYQIIQARKLERESRRKMICYLKFEEERQRKLREEEEIRQREEAERRRKEEAERKAKLDEIAEKQRQRERELEEKERQWREEVLGRSPAAAPARAIETPAVARAAEPGVTTAPTPGKYVPKFKRASAESAAQPQAPPPAASDRWGSRPDDRAPPHTDRWRDDHRPSSFGSSGPPRSTWSSSRARGER